MCESEEDVQETIVFWKEYKSQIDNMENFKISLRIITEENFIDAFNLKLANGQERFVSHPIRSLAQAYVYRNQCQTFGIYNLVSVFVIIGAYLNMENPLFQKLSAHNKEMVMGFATLVENRDGNIKDHIRRTTNYVEMLAKELKNRGLYKDELTEDYIKNLIMAAPMHDVGKIAIPDAILQKPGKLTVEEFDVMKTHAAKGGEIIKETFKSMSDEEYEKIAYQVARFHHEKWNGKGYPEGLSRKEIPLCARIMAVADVFDAVSAKRCYRDAMPLEQCFAIIENGSG